MELSQFGQTHIRTTRFEFGDEDFIELREPTTDEVAGVGKDEAKNAKIFEDLFPKAIVGSSFTVDGVPATAGQVATAIKGSAALYAQIINTWVEDMTVDRKSPSPQGPWQADFLGWRRR